ncbi:hypothetical protein IFM89_015994 [Coptis chinensis]|uniref:RRM domain-containing protein n=1 Tax=Coptis chinensis TaxID=261450 RepID=A0A835HN32_9MAGN|nr:hypothetical protein IFM89_015994 [Coptis chinensis]
MDYEKLEVESGIEGEEHTELNNLQLSSNKNLSHCVMSETFIMHMRNKLGLASTVGPTTLFDTIKVQYDTITQDIPTILINRKPITNTYQWNHKQTFIDSERDSDKSPHSNGERMGIIAINFNFSSVKDFVEYSLQMAALPISSSFGSQPSEGKGKYGLAGPASLSQRQIIHNEVFKILEGEVTLSSNEESGSLKVEADKPLRLEIDPISPFRVVGPCFTIICRAESWKFEECVDTLPTKDPGLAFSGQKVIQVEEQDSQVDLALGATGPALVGESFLVEKNHYFVWSWDERTTLETVVSANEELVKLREEATSLQNLLSSVEDGVENDDDASDKLAEVPTLGILRNRELILVMNEMGDTTEGKLTSIYAAAPAYGGAYPVYRNPQQQEVFTVSKQGASMCMEVVNWKYGDGGDGGDGRDLGLKWQHIIDQPPSFYGAPPGSNFMCSASPPPPPHPSSYAYSAQPPPPFSVVRLCGVPFDCAEPDIVEFFRGLNIVDILLVNKDGRFSGEPFCVMGYPLQIVSEGQPHSPPGRKARRAKSSDDNKDSTEHTGIFATERRVHIVMNSDGRPSGEAYVEFANADDLKATMSGEDEWFYGAYANLVTKFVKKEDIPIGGIQSAEIYLGRDTRPIGVVVIDMGILITPQLHWMVHRKNMGMKVFTCYGATVELVGITETGYTADEGKRNRAKASPSRDFDASQLGMYGHGVWKKVCIIFHLNCVANNICTLQFKEENELRRQMNIILQNSLISTRQLDTVGGVGGYGGSSGEYGATVGGGSDNLFSHGQPTNQ